MNLYNQKNILSVIVGKNETYVAEDVLIDNYSDLNDGNVAIIDQDNYVRDTAAGAALSNTEILRFVTRVGTNLIYSPAFKTGDIESIKMTSYYAATQQVTYLGYAGTGTGNIEAIDNNEYIVRVLVENSILSRNKQMYKFGAYKSGNAATSAEVAIGLAGNLAFNFKREPTETIKFDAVCNAAGTELLGADDTVLGYKGETKIVIAEVGGATVAYALAAGDYIRIGTAVTDPVYKVISGSLTAADGGTIYVDRPLTAAVSGTATGIVEYITAAEGAAAIWGIKCTGIAATEFKPGVFDGSLVRFKLEPSNCGSTTVTYSTAAAPGSGTYVQVAELEWFAQGNLGLKYRVDTPPVTLHTQASSSATYELITIKYKIRGGGQDSVTGTTPNSWGEIILAFYKNSDCGDKILATLSEWHNTYKGSTLSWAT